MNSTEIRAALEAHAVACREAIAAMRPRPELSQETRANLAGANLADANLADAYLAGANLARANLADAYLARANLADANLADANLADAYLAGANLADAYLAGANLAGANLAGAYLARAYLARAYLAPDEKIVDWLQIGPIGSRRAMLTAIRADKGVTILTGCFRDTLDQFVAAVERLHGTSKHGLDYGAAVALIRARFEVPEVAKAPAEVRAEA